MYLGGLRPKMQVSALSIFRSSAVTSSESIAASATLAPGMHTIRLECRCDDGLDPGGTGPLFADGEKAAEREAETTAPMHISLAETLDGGEDRGTPVPDDYQVPSRPSGTFEKLVDELE
jgi:hypothetical protein